MRCSFAFLFHTKSVAFSVYSVFYHIQFALGTFQMLGGHTRLAAVVLLDSEPSEFPLLGNAFFLFLKCVIFRYWGYFCGYFFECLL